MPIELTREDLFKQVWERPMIKVASDYGISDVALKKICTKHRIPVPGRGHWAKIAAGKKVERAYFRNVSDPAINRILIHGSPAQDLPAAVKAAATTAKKRERQPENKVLVTSAPEVLHPQVERTKRKLEKSKPSADGLVTALGVNFFDVEIGQDSVGRVAAFLNALVTAAESRGYQFIKGEKALVVSVDGELLDFRIVEQKKRSKHEPTKAERIALDKWEKQQQRPPRSWEYPRWTPRPTLAEPKH